MLGGGQEQSVRWVGLRAARCAEKMQHLVELLQLLGGDPGEVRGPALCLLRLQVLQLCSALL